jgi:hypothetical protein
MAREEYGTDPGEFRDAAVSALESLETTDELGADAPEA